MTRTMILLTILAALARPEGASGQSLGTFRWQLQPYCNVVVVSVTENGAFYRLEGIDDQCGAGRDQASVLGMAFPNPDGTIGLGVTIVTAPGGGPVHVDADISLATLSGTWRDSTGDAGTFVFTPHAGAGGNPRPPAPSIPRSVQLSTAGSLVASGAFGIGAVPASGGGVRMMWHPAKAAFRAGEVGADEWDEANIGDNSTALGRNTRASGSGSTALGKFATASGDGSVAMGVSVAATAANSTAMGEGSVASAHASTAIGFRTTAGGTASVALGDNTTASAPGSTAIGLGTTASGIASTALGYQTIAAGVGSVALGSYAVANGNGSFVFADRSSSAQLFANNENEFVVRAASGARFFSSGSANLGPVLLPNAQDWSAASDVNLKHQFRELDNADVLARIARMPVTEWSYKEQDASIRHMGPTAQDFYAAFGLGQDRLRIGTIDADGVALAAVRALEARTRDLRDDFNARVQEIGDEHARLRETLVDVLRRNADLTSRLARLEALVDKR
ncbi:MAG: tail fiber domain-containing protein [Acidobacteriota bacterium]|nr:tail fiber domain-containing protein [Acidobacteriota bacterium]